MSLGTDGTVMTVPMEPAGAYSNNGFGDGGNWWWIILLFLCFGWGNNGWGNNGGAGMQGALTRGDLCQDMNFSDLASSVRGVQQGICDSTFALNNTIVNGFNGVQRDMCTAFASVNAGLNENRFATQQGFNATQMAMMQGFNAAQAQASDCCCKTQTNLMQLGNQVERGFCQTNFNDQANTNAIIQNAHSDTDRVLARLDAMEMSRKDETIANLRQQLQTADFQASQQAQNNYLVNTLRPCPTPSYITCNPWASQAAYGSCGTCGCGC